MFYFCSFFNQIKQKTPKKQRYNILLQNVITYIIYSFNFVLFWNNECTIQMFSSKM
jgi:hypothetical protein